MTTLTNLIERVEAATGADREIEWAVAYSLGLGTETERSVYAELGGSGFLRGPEGLSALDKKHGSHIRYSRYVGGGRRRGVPGGEIMRVVTGPQPLAHCPNYTASIDAAKALLDEYLPGWYMMIDGSLMTSFEVSLTDSSVPSAEVREDVSRFFARGKTLPLAILAALLRSKLHTEGKG